VHTFLEGWWALFCTTDGGITFFKVILSRDEGMDTLELHLFRYYYLEANLVKGEVYICNKFSPFKKTIHSF
jgi:hypothetical protein